MTVTRLRRLVTVLVLAGGLLSYLVATSPQANAATTMSVTSAADTNTAGTLRYALNMANVTPGNVEIDFQSGLYGITLTGALPVYTGGGGNFDLTINGAGTTIYGTSLSDVLASTSSGSLDLNQITLTGGANGVNDTNGDVTVTNSTVFGNRLSGIYDTGGTVSLVYATVVDNATAGAPNANVRTISGNMSSFGSVVATAQDGATDCSIGGAVMSDGYNSSDDSSCGFTGTGDHEDQDAGLGRATACHGSACTEYWIPGAPLVDAIPISNCQDDGASGITVDEIGTVRPWGSGCDIGAIETEYSSICACPTEISYGYWLVGADGDVAAFGSALFEGSLPGLGIHVHDIVGMAGSGDDGYWLVSADGGVFAFGSAPFEGSLPALGIHVHDIVGMASSPDGNGYWLVGADGAVFSFGDAAYSGSLPGRGIHVNDITGMTSDGWDGYWLAGSDGGVFAFGSAAFSGSLAGRHLAQPITGIGGNYSLVGADGGVFAFGDTYAGSLPAEHLDPLKPIAGIASYFRGTGS